MREKLPLSMAMRDHSRQLRAGMTDAELRLWYFLRNRRFLGLKFRRQIALPPYVLDFYCAEHGLAIELDGSQHLESGNDAIRDAWLLYKGVVVLRFWNHDVMMNAESVLESIRLKIERLSLTPHPSPEGRGVKTREE